MELDPMEDWAGLKNSERNQNFKKSSTFQKSSNFQQKKVQNFKKL